MAEEQPEGGSNTQQTSLWKRPVIIIGAVVAVALAVLVANSLGIVSIGDTVRDSPSLSDGVEPTNTPNPQAVDELSPGAIAFIEATWCRTISHHFADGYDEFGRPLPPRQNAFVYVTGAVSEINLNEGHIALDINTVTVQGDDAVITLFKNEQCYSKIYLRGDFPSSALGSPNVGDQITAACIPRRYEATSGNQLGYKEFTWLYAQDCQRIGAGNIPTPTSTPQPFSLGG